MAGSDGVAGALGAQPGSHCQMTVLPIAHALL